jgi:hypothetical protein
MFPVGYAHNAREFWFETPTAAEGAKTDPLPGRGINQTPAAMPAKAESLLERLDHGESFLLRYLPTRATLFLIPVSQFGLRFLMSQLSTIIAANIGMRKP